MARRKQPKLPDPQAVICGRCPSDRGGTYIAITRAADRYLAKAEEAIRMAAILWADVDSGLEYSCDELAETVLQQRRDMVDQVSGLYGDRLNEGVF